MYSLRLLDRVTKGPNRQTVQPRNWEEIRLLIFMMRSMEIGFHPIIRGSSSSTPLVWYDGLFVKPCSRCQLSGMNSKVAYKVVNWHPSPSLRRVTAAVRPSFLAAATSSDWPAIRVLGLIEYRFHLTFCRFHSTRPNLSPPLRVIQLLTEHSSPQS